MIQQLTLTGDRKMMNMQKVGTLTQSKSGFKNEVKTGYNSMNTGKRVIHYANIRGRPSGTVRGIVSHLTYFGLAVSPPEVSLDHLAISVSDRSQVAVLVPLQLILITEALPLPRFHPANLDGLRLGGGFSPLPNCSAFGNGNGTKLTPRFRTLPAARQARYTGADRAPCLPVGRLP